jgi:hypothetical protein
MTVRHELHVNWRNESVTICNDVLPYFCAFGRISQFGSYSPKLLRPSTLYWYPRQESNLNLEFRKPLFYPLNYGDNSHRAVDDSAI